MYLYEIVNTVNSKRYYGQTVMMLSQRWGDHKKALRLGNHRNCHLQRAWSKYGEAVFDFRLIQECASLEDLNRLEEELIRCDSNCYNLKAGGQNSRHSEETKKKMSKALLGKKRPGFYPSWLHNENSILLRQQAKTPNGKYPIVMSPEGERFEFHNMKQFALSHGLVPSGLRHVVIGKCKSHRGWRLETTKAEDAVVAFSYSKIKRPQGYPTLISPSGDIYNGIRSMNQFAKEHGLQISRLSCLVNGKQRTHKGWTVQQ